jgi:hypothetical protein
MLALTTVTSRRGAIRGATFLAALFLGALTVKDWQEVAGVRVLSSALPLLFLFFLQRVSCPLSLPRPVLYLVVAECLALPALSIFTKRTVSFYELYLPWTVISAVLFIAFFRRFISVDMTKIGELYSKSLIIVCLLSFAFTAQVTWFGAFSIASLSDFSTFFALQLSLAVPFLLFKGNRSIIALFLVTLWFLFSRLSLVLTVIAMLVQRIRINNLRSITLNIAALSGLGIGAFLLAQTSLGTQFTSKLVNTSSSLVGSGDEALNELNPSDMGRLAYMAITIGAVTASSFFTGHGIRSNAEIIAEQFDAAAWGLDESFAVGAVHNVYLEIFSDSGILALVGLLTILVFTINRLRRRGVRDPIFLSALLFFFSYLFEGNYVSFFFQCFLVYFLWAASLEVKEPR